MRLHRKRIRSSLQALAIMVLVLVPHVIHAQAQRSILSVNIDATLTQSGKIDVAQVLTYPAPVSLSWPVFGRVSAISITADGQQLPDDNVTQKRNEDQTIISAPSTRATHWQIRYQSTSHLIRSKERDQLYMPLLREQGSSIEALSVVFRLPTSATGSGLVGNTYAIGGVGRMTTEAVDARTIAAHTNQVGPKAIVTLNAHWPTTVLRLGPIQELRLGLANLEILPWLVIGALLPLISLLVLLRLLIRQRFQERTVVARHDTPPDSLSPLLVGVLVHKKIYPREIVAMIIDLCRRGYIVIVKKSGQYYLSQRKPLDSSLEPWERDILEALFPVANARLTAKTMSALNRQALFNPKVRHAFQAIYEAVTTKEYFAENPHRTRVRYKLFALALYFTSVIGAIWVAIVGASPYLLLPIAGTMLVCRLIIAYTPGLIRYTSVGRQARGAWLGFAQYLRAREPLPLESARNFAFETLLGYAIALEATEEWAKRFDLSNIVIVRPDWFVSYEETTTAQFATEIEQFSASISKMLTEMRGPIVS